jgi:sporulation protein YlmC with PRC-barrel domain
MSSQDVQANRIKGSTVLSSKGQNLGTLADIVVNYDSGRIDLGLISLNPDAGGISGQLVPVPWSLLKPSKQAATPEAASMQPLSFVFDGKPAKLQGAPSFSQDNWPNVNQPSWRQTVYSHYDVKPPTYNSSGTTTPTGNQDVLANRIKGSTVLSSSGQNLGTLSDIIVNYATGRIDLGLLSLNPSAGGTSGHLVPVHWNLLRPASQSMSSEVAGMQPLLFVFSGDATALHAAPSFSLNNWPDVNQSSWRQGVYSYYSVTPSAQGGAESPGGKETGSESK